jgi:MFS family permease
MAVTAPQICVTDIPARLDRLPWDRFHGLVVVALGITWILDGLEVTLLGSLSVAIAESPSLGFTPTQIGLAASAYIAGAVSGALLFGQLSDSYGRKRLFTITVAIYALATVMTGFAWDFWSFAVFRFLTGAGIGGEYAAINSAIQEFIPARWRGYVDLAINGSFWIGAALGALGAIVVLDPRFFDPDVGWRFAFVVGGLLALLVIYLRRYVPESPRWLMTHGRVAEAEGIVAGIENEISRRRGVAFTPDNVCTISLRPWRPITMAEVAGAIMVRHRRRAVLGLVLMATQAFCYNAIFFTYALVLTRFYGIPAADVGWFILPFAVGNVLGPLLLGRFFDTIGRKVMIASTYAISGILLAASGYLFAEGVLSATEQTVAWSVIFFFASSAASAAYLTVGESFPLEVRAMAIGIFYAFGTALGGITGPAVFGALIETGSRQAMMGGYVAAGVLMIVAAGVEWVLGVPAERRPLEDVARPLSCPD